jgi:hypothetical protein
LKIHERNINTDLKNQINLYGVLDWFLFYCVLIILIEASVMITVSFFDHSISVESTFALVIVASLNTSDFGNLVNNLGQWNLYMINFERVYNMGQNIGVE